MLIYIECCILTLLLHIKATAPIINNHRYCKLIATGPQYLFQVLPRINIKLHGPELSKGLPVKIGVQGHGLNTDLAAEILRRQLVHVAWDLGDLFSALPGDAEPRAFKGHLDPRIVRLLSFRIQDWSLEQGSLNGILRVWVVRIVADGATLRPQLEFEIAVAPLPDEVLRWIVHDVGDSTGAVVRSKDLRHILVILKFVPVLVIAKQIHI